MKRAYLEPHDFDEDAMPTPCMVCGGIFDLTDGSPNPRKENETICEGCADDIEKEIEKEEEIEECLSLIEDAKITIRDGIDQLLLLGYAVVNHKLDTDKYVFFYEQDFYVLSNFSAFTIERDRILFPTSEHAYHYYKFEITAPHLARAIIGLRSAHEAFKFAELQKEHRRKDWDDVKAGIMKSILLDKVSQHSYVKYKLLQTGNRILVEDSWRDSVWGWGPDRKGQNLLGKIWMEIREELKNAKP